EARRGSLPRGSSPPAPRDRLIDRPVELGLDSAVCFLLRALDRRRDERRGLHRAARVTSLRGADARAVFDPVPEERIPLGADGQAVLPCGRDICPRWARDPEAHAHRHSPIARAMALDEEPTRQRALAVARDRELPDLPADLAAEDAR